MLIGESSTGDETDTDLSEEEYDESDSGGLEADYMLVQPGFSTDDDDNDDDDADVRCASSAWLWHVERVRLV